MAQKPLKALSSVPLLSDLDKRGLDVVIQAATSKHYTSGETVFWQSEPCAGLYIVQEGWLKAVITSPSGREQIIRLLGPGDTFNEIGLLTDGKNLVTVRALEVSQLWVIERETILRLMDEYPRLCRAFTRTLAERVQHLMKLIEDLSLRTVKSRMARILLENAVDGLINRQRWMRRDEKDIARLQRQKESFPKGSPERRKVLRALNHAYQRATYRRNNFAHQESHKLVNTCQLIVFEALDIQGMQGNGNKVVNRGIADVAWGQFVQYTSYKTENAGRMVLFVNPKGTTQRCSGCGELVPKDLTVRTHNCPHCGLRIDRDLNASLNILARGLASLRPGPVEAPAFRRGE